MGKSYLILVVMLIVFLLTACAPQTGVTAALGQEFSLTIGESVAIKGEKLEITFVKVLEDSRCPIGVQCIWEGRARILVSIMSNNTTEVELTEPGLTNPPNRQTYLDYQIDFRLLPYPEAGKEITADQYRLQMSINKPK